MKPFYIATHKHTWQPEEKYIHEICKLRRELELANEKILNLSTQLTANVSHLFLLPFSFCLLVFITTNQLLLDFEMRDQISSSFVFYCLFDTFLFHTIWRCQIQLNMFYWFFFKNTFLICDNTFPRRYTENFKKIVHFSRSNCPISCVV